VDAAAACATVVSQRGAHRRRSTAQVRREQQRETQAELRREQARRGDPAAAAAVGAEAYFQDRELDRAGEHFAAAAAKGDAFGDLLHPCWACDL